jgi:hypothetical protein
MFILISLSTDCFYLSQTTQRNCSLIWQTITKIDQTNIVVRIDPLEIMKHWTGFIWFGVGSVAGSSDHGNEPSGFIKGGEFFGQLSEYQLLKKNSALISKLAIRVQLKSTYNTICRRNTRRFYSYVN